MEIKKLTHEESKRTYYTKCGNKIIINKVTHFLDSNTTHRLICKKGNLYIVHKKDILYIKIKSIRFSF